MPGQSLWSLPKATVGMTPSVLLVRGYARLKVQRTYVICANTKFIIGVVDPKTFNLVGGGFPLAVTNPNVHIMCQVPGTCIFEGNAPAILSIQNTSLLDSFLKLQNSPPLPATYRPDTSNLLMEGLVFRGIADLVGAGIGQPIISLVGFGLNMTMKNCLWTQSNATFPPYGALAIARFADYGLTIQGGGSLFVSLLLDNCTVRDNVFNRAGMLSQVEFANLTLPSHKITVRNSVFERNTIKNQYRNGSSTIQASDASVLELGDSITDFTDVMIKNNTITKARGTVVLINSYFSYSNLRFKRNVIVERRGFNCTDVARVTRYRNRSSSSGYSYRSSGCIEFDSNGVAVKPPTRMPTPKPPPTQKPTRRPSTTRPTRRPTTFAPNLFSPVE